MFSNETDIPLRIGLQRLEGFKPLTHQTVEKLKFHFEVFFLNSLEIKGGKGEIPTKPKKLL